MTSPRNPQRPVDVSAAELAAIGSTRTEADAVAEVAAAASIVRVLNVPDVELLPGVLLVDVPTGRRTVQVQDLEPYLATPRIKTGTVAFDDPAHFADYVHDMLEEGTRIWADADHRTVTAVIDDHIGNGITGAPGWARHRATLNLHHTDQWRHWAGQDGKLLAQADFAEHVEYGAGAVRQPSAADMLELAQSFHAATDVTFRSGTRLRSGETKLIYDESVTASAGRSGEIDIPDTITLSLAVFEGGEPVEVTARFRYRLAQGGRLHLGYRIAERKQVERAGLTAILTAIEANTGRAPYLGQPRPRG